MVKFVINGGQEGMFGVVVLKLSTGVGISQGVQNGCRRKFQLEIMVKP